MKVWHNTIAVFGDIDVDVVLGEVAVMFCMRVVLRHAAACHQLHDSWRASLFAECPQTWGQHWLLGQAVVRPVLAYIKHAVKDENEIVQVSLNVKPTHQVSLAQGATICAAVLLMMSVYDHVKFDERFEKPYCKAAALRQHCIINRLH